MPIQLDGSFTITFPESARPDVSQALRDYAVKLTNDAEVIASSGKQKATLHAGETGVPFFGERWPELAISLAEDFTRRARAMAILAMLAAGDAGTRAEAEAILKREEENAA